MQTVELLDGEPERPHEDVLEAARSRRRLRWWLVGPAVLLVVVLGAVQWVLRSREEAQITRLAAVDGVVAQVDGPLDVRRRYSEADARLLFGSQGSELVRGADGSLTYEWRTDSGGDPLWSRQLLGPVPALAGALSVFGASRCEPDVGPDADVSSATRVVCLVTDGGVKTLDTDGSAELVAATTAFVEVLDTATGTPLAHWPAPSAQTFTLLGGQIVVGAAEQAADVFTSRAVLTGEIRWTHVVPIASGEVAADLTWRQIDASRAGELVALRTSTGDVQLVSADGQVVRDWSGDQGSSRGVEVDPTGRIILESWDAAGSETVTILTSDGHTSAVGTLQGALLSAQVDDGSVRLLLTTDQALHAWDPDTGSQRWSSTEVSGGASSVLVVRGHLYVLGSGGVAALDGRTGATLWRMRPDRGLMPAMLLTDAHHLLVGYEPSAGDAEPLLVAYDFEGGTEVSRAPYPDGIDHLAIWGGKLIGYGDASGELAELG